MKSNRKTYLFLFFVICCFFFVITVLSAARDFQREVSHDENQFLASGAVLEEKATIPYLEYPYFHMPDLVFVYAVLAATTNYYFLAARFSSVLSSVLLLGIVFWWTAKMFSQFPAGLRFLAAMAAVLLLFSNPIFIEASGLAENQDISILLAVISVVIIIPPKEKTLEYRRAYVSGLLMGFAAGTRLTYSLALFPLLFISLFIYRSEANRMGLKTAFALLLGFTTAMVPSIVLYFIAPDQFIFGNITYATLNTAYQFQIGGWSSILTKSGKIAYVRDTIISEPHNLILFIGFISISFVELWRIVKSKKVDLRGHYWIPVLVLPFILFATMLPNPIWGQYFYAPLPFLLIGMLAGLSRLSQHKITAWGICGCLFMAGIYGVSSSLDAYSNPGVLFHPDTWIPVEVHNEAMMVNRLRGEGPVLTLAPLYVVDGNVPIYPSLVTGPFAWRVGDLVDVSTQQRMELITPSNLLVTLELTPPGAILVGIEPEALEEPFIEYAKVHHYLPIDLGNGHTLWVPKK